MAGQIIPRGKSTWLVRIFLGVDQRGKRIYKNHTVHGTKKDAETWRTGALRERDLGHFDVRQGKKTTMTDLFDLVLTDYRNGGKDHDWAEGVVRVRLTPH